jgi:hypothetical protein
MKAGYLRTGDVIFLQKGTVVACPNAPVVIANHSISAFSPKTGDIWVKIGIESANRTDVTQEKKIIRDQIIKAFTDLEIALDESIMDRFIAHQVKNRPEQKIFLPSAHYLVVETTYERGTHHVWCQEFHSENPVKIYFWQGAGEKLSPLVHNDIKAVSSFF